MFCTDLCHVEYSKRPRVRAPVSEITYTVLSGTLNSTIPYHPRVPRT